jgi:hypothetical protein
MTRTLFTAFFLVNMQHGSVTNSWKEAKTVLIFLESVFFYVFNKKLTTFLQCLRLGSLLVSKIEQEELKTYKKIEHLDIIFKHFFYLHISDPVNFCIFDPVNNYHIYQNL